MKKFFYTVVALSVNLVVSAASLSKEQTETLNERIKDYTTVSSFCENRALVIKDGKAGFINKLGEVVIPLQFENVDRNAFFRNGLSLDFSFGAIDSLGNRVVPEGKVTRIARFPQRIDRDINNFPQYVPLDAIEIETEPNKKVAYCFENGKLLFTMDNDWPVINEHTGKVLSKTKKGQKIYFGEKELQKQGYQNPRNWSHNPMGITRGEGLVLKKDDKYVVVDTDFNELSPFQSNSWLNYVDGVVVYIDCRSIDTEVGEQTYPFTTSLYKNKKLLFDKLYSDYNKFGSYLFFDGQDINEDFKQLIGEDTPESAKKKVLCTLDGNVVDAIPLGKNRLKLYVEGENVRWKFEDASGKPIIDEDVKPVSGAWFGKKCVALEAASVTSGLRHICVDVATGDTVHVPEYSDVFSYIENGVVKFSDLQKYDVHVHTSGFLGGFNIMFTQRDNELNTMFLKNMYNPDNLIHLKSVKSGKFLEQGFQDVTYFSDELLKVKYKDRWYFLNDKGEGIK
ncbi:MAG: hypothetical protein MJZ19_08690 [Paludibacteraceae bacterium]|nr:hypothetical protein [Paludibacteraceae bacterium]